MSDVHVDLSAVHAMRARRAALRSGWPVPSLPPRVAETHRLSPWDPILLARAASERRGARSLRPADGRRDPQRFYL
jgi:hypothetical protein